MLELFEYAFMQRAFIAALLVGAVSPIIGSFIVMRRLSFIGDTLSHTALAGVTIGVMVGLNPIIGGMVIAVLAALGINKLREQYRNFEELAMLIISSAGMALAIVLISLSGGFTTSISTYLFGSIVVVTKMDLLAISLMAVTILLVVIFLYKELLFISFDEESAKISGIKYRSLNLIFVILVALTIAVSMRIVGILLISAMMIIPVATSMQIAKSFKQTLVLAILFAEIASISGFIIAYYFNIASGGTIVLISIVLLLVVLFIKKLIINR
jgi:zinc transport system permease protein